METQQVGPEDVLTIKEACQILMLSEPRIRALCRGKRIGRYVGRQWLFTRSELEQFAKMPRRVGRPKKEPMPC